MQSGDPLGAAEGPTPGEATRILQAAVAGDVENVEELSRLVYAELHAMATRAMTGERDDHTLQPTALVSEAWLKLFESRASDLQDRRHFLAVAARAMRQILVDHARTRRRVKRGGGWQRVAIDVEAGMTDTGEGFDLVALDGAIEELHEHAPRQAQVVELRFFAGLSVERAAETLDVSESTIAREWRFARAWLLRRLKQS